MTETSRRSFLVGLFGAAVVAAAGPIPKALLALPEEEFKAAVEIATSSYLPGIEIYCDGKDYSFTPLPGFRPMREESDRLCTQALSDLFAQFQPE